MCGGGGGGQGMRMVYSFFDSKVLFCDSEPVRV